MRTNWTVRDIMLLFISVASCWAVIAAFFDPIPLLTLHDGLTRIETKKTACTQPPIGFKNKTGICYFISVLQLLHQAICNPTVKEALDKMPPQDPAGKLLKDTLDAYSQASVDVMNQRAEIILMGIVPERGAIPGSSMKTCYGSAAEALLVLTRLLLDESPYLFCVGQDCTSKKLEIEPDRKFKEAIGIIRASTKTVEALQFGKGSLPKPTAQYILHQNVFLSHFSKLLEEANQPLPPKPYEGALADWLYAEVQSNARAKEVTWPACLIFLAEFKLESTFGYVIPSISGTHVQLGTGFPETLIIHRDDPIPVIYQISGVLAKYHASDLGAYHTVTLIRRGETWYICDNETCTPMAKTSTDTFALFQNEGGIQYGLLHPLSDSTHHKKLLLPSALLFERTNAYDEAYEKATKKSP